MNVPLLSGNVFYLAPDAHTTRLLNSAQGKKLRDELTIDNESRVRFTDNFYEDGETVKDGRLVLAEALFPMVMENVHVTEKDHSFLLCCNHPTEFLALRFEKTW